MANSSDGSRQAKAKSRTRKASSANGGKRKRTVLDAARAERREKTMWAHFWRVCGMCGGDMFEQESMGIRFEVCRGCHGIYFDQAELALAAGHKDPAAALKALLEVSRKPQTEKID